MKSKNPGRAVLSREHKRVVTTEPPLVPASLRCPCCDSVMQYVSSCIGGVSARHSEQWDYFECAFCRAAFEFRQRTRKLRPFAFDVPLGSFRPRAMPPATRSGRS